MKTWKDILQKLVTAQWSKAIVGYFGIAKFKLTKELSFKINFSQFSSILENKTHSTIENNDQFQPHFAQLHVTKKIFIVL